MQQDIYILGGSGHALVVTDIAALMGLNIAGYFDHEHSGVLSDDVPYLGPESAENMEKISPDSFFFPAIGDNHIRSKVISFLESQKRKEILLIHPDSCIASDSWIGASTMIGPKAIVNPQAHIGRGLIINSGAIIEHECVVGDFAHIAPGATLLGNVKVGEYSFVGANAVIKQGITIGSNVVIGAGSVVLEDVPDNCVMVGNPAKILK